MSERQRSGHLQQNQQPGPHERASLSGFELNQLPVIPHDATTFRSPGKTPGLKERNNAWTLFPAWQKPQVTSLARAREYDAWGAGLGFRAGVNGLVGIDFDITQSVALDKITEFFLDRTGNIPDFPRRDVDFTGHLKTLFACVAVDPFDQPVSLGSTDINFDLPYASNPAVQILAAGKYFNAIGIHPDRKAPYVWNVDILSLGLQGLPRIPAQDLLDFINDLPAFLVSIGATVTSKGHAREAGAWKTLTERETLPNKTIIDILRIVPNDRSFVPGYEEWIRIGLILKGAAEDPDDLDLLDAWVRWSESWNGSRRRGAHQDPAGKWATFAPEHTHAGSLRNWLDTVAAHPKPGDPDFATKEARALSLDDLDLHPQTSLKPEQRLTPVAPGLQSQSPSPSEDCERLLVELRKARAVNPAYDEINTRKDLRHDTLVSIRNMPVTDHAKRPHMLGGLLRGRAALWTGPAGGGKSALALSFAMAIAHEDPTIVGLKELHFPGDCVLVANEDPSEEILRRVDALERHRSLIRSNMKHDIHPTTTTLVQKNADGTVSLICPDFLRLLIKLRKQTDIALIVLDTMITVTEGADENSSVDQQKVMVQLQRIATAAWASVIVLHHPSKAAGQDDAQKRTLSAARGSGAAGNAVRLAYAITDPTTEERDRYGWNDEQSRDITVIESVKGSWQKRPPKLYFRKLSIDVPTIDPDNPGTPIPPDNALVLEPFEPTMVTVDKKRIDEAFDKLKQAIEVDGKVIRWQPHPRKRDGTVQELLDVEDAAAIAIVARLQNEGKIGLRGTKINRNLAQVVTIVKGFEAVEEPVC